MDHITSTEKSADLFAAVFGMFGNCHRGYNSSHCMSNADIDEPGNINLIIV